MTEMEEYPFAEMLAEVEAEAEADEQQKERKHQITREYLTELDANLIERGWTFNGAKTVEFGYQDQSLLNHVRNGVYLLIQLNELTSDMVGARTLSDTELRKAIAMFVAHDLHKTRETEGPEDEFDIPRELVAEFVSDVGLKEFAPELSVDDYWSCACAHHDTWNAKTTDVTLAFTELQGHVRLADALASTSSPEAVVDERTRRAFNDVFYDGLSLRYHQLTDVKGILTNLCNSAVASQLNELGYHVLSIYQDGCVYVAPDGRSEPTVDKQFIESVYQSFKDVVQDSHHSYTDPAQLMGSIETGRLGYYDPAPEDFFYAGPEAVVRAMVLKAAEDGDTDDAPTDSMSDSIAKVDDEVLIDLDDTRQLVGAARLVYGLHRTVVPELQADADDFTVTCDLFDVSDEVQTALRETRERAPNLLKSGGKWEYSYAIGQEILNREFGGIASKNLSPSEFAREVTGFLLTRLGEYDGWGTIEQSFTENIRTEVIAYLRDVLVVDGDSASFDTALSDPYDEYTGKRGGKLCTLCNRGTTSTRKSDMETKKSFSTLQAGFSNRTRVGAGKPEKLLLCSPCRIELSLRETGSTRREAGRLFFHFTPDYFYTPLSWELTHRLFNRYDGASRVRLSQLAESVFTGTADEQAHRTVIENLTADEDAGGLVLAESLSQGFDEGFGALQMGYFKPHENDTEFQFFGVYVALAVAAYTGLRVLVTENPVPELRGRDFPEAARLGAGMAPVKRFYGDAVRLADLEGTLQRTSALIQLGYAIEHSDSLFAKHLRVTRSERLPGSHLLKRIVRDDPDEGSRIAWNLMDEARYLDITTGVTTHD
jgi:CRISPR-associated protein Csc3